METPKSIRKNKQRVIATAPIGVFDSGVGGLSVLKAIWSELPGEQILYLADQAHVPYGPRPLEEVRAFATEISRFLQNEGVKLIVVACNAASAAALHHLRRIFPDMPFVGMEPAVKPATEQTLSGVVGVLATPATFQGELYASVVERFAHDVELIQHTCPGLVDLIENGRMDSPDARRILENAINPMQAQGIDTIVLGCTHYPFVIPIIQEIAGPDVRVIDPAPAVARQVRRVLTRLEMLGVDSPPLKSPVGKSKSKHDPLRIPRTHFMTSGDPRKLTEAIELLLKVEMDVSALHWDGLRLTSLPGKPPLV